MQPASPQSIYTLISLFPPSFSFHFIYRRYEIEYDENRLQIGRDIGRRFLGIEIDGGKRVNDSGGGGGGGNTTTGNGNGEAGGNGSNENGNDGSNSEGKKNDNNKENTSKEINLNCEKDELVLDVLNDDLISKVRGRLTRTYNIIHK